MGQRRFSPNESVAWSVASGRKEINAIHTNGQKIAKYLHHHRSQVDARMARILRRTQDSESDFSVNGEPLRV